jgi:predicted phage tail protein
VPDGFGGAERRYQVNAVIADQTDAFTLVQTMASAFRGMTYWGAGQIRVSNDMPKNPVKLVNQANVKDGLFDYQGTSRKTRHNLVRAMWRDPGNRYSPTPEGVEITADIANRGQVAADIVAWGCTSRGLAHRWAKWLLFSENQQTEVVQYDAGLYHMDLRPGEIFQLQDPAYFGTRWAGRLRTGSTAGVLLLDGLVDLGTSTSFTVTVVMPDNTVAHQALTLPNFSIAASGDDQYTVISFAAVFADAAAAGRVDPGRQRPAAAAVPDGADDGR